MKRSIRFAAIGARSLGSALGLGGDLKSMKRDLRPSAARRVPTNFSDTPSRDAMAKLHNGRETHAQSAGELHQRLTASRTNLSAASSDVTHDRVEMLGNAGPTFS